MSIPAQLKPFLERIVKIENVEGLPGSKESYFGGYPFVPKNGDTWEWPVTEDGNPLAFIVQINFEDISKDFGYPEKGILQIFVDMDAYEYDFEGGLKAIYYDEKTLALESTSKPTDAGPEIDEATPFMDDYVPHKIVFRESYQIPPSLYFDARNDDVEIMGKAKDLSDLIDEIGLDATDEFTNWNHHLGGQPFWVQYPPIEEGDPTPTFMLQIDTDDYMMFGDAGNMHVWGSLEKLQKGDFSDFQWEWACG